MPSVLFYLFPTWTWRAFPECLVQPNGFNRVLQWPQRGDWPGSSMGYTVYTTKAEGGVIANCRLLIRVLAMQVARELRLIPRATRKKKGGRRLVC